MPQCWFPKQSEPQKWLPESSGDLLACGTLSHVCSGSVPLDHPGGSDRDARPKGEISHWWARICARHVTVTCSVIPRVDPPLAGAEDEAGPPVFPGRCHLPWGVSEVRKNVSTELMRKQRLQQKSKENPSSQIDLLRETQEGVLKDSPCGQ